MLEQQASDLEKKAKTLANAINLPGVVGDLCHLLIPPCLGGLGPLPDVLLNNTFGHLTITIERAGIKGAERSGHMVFHLMTASLNC